MKSRPWGIAAALCLIASIVAGCATADRPSAFAAGKLKGAKSKCEWTYELSVDKKRIDGKSLELTEKSKQDGCEKKEFDPPLYIGNDPAKAGLRVKDIGAVEIDAEGSCYYCYINAFGGMTCVRYC